MTNNFEIKVKEDKPVVAICYDFDKTLSPDDMQAQGFIQHMGYDVTAFWEKSNGLAQANDMDTNLAYMYTMLDTSIGKEYLTRDTLRNYGSRIKLFPGVAEWFSRICQYGEEHGVIVEHYIISSGLKEMIEGTSIAHKFVRIYASAFYFDDTNIPKWPAQVVNYTNKTQFLFRIEKGVLDINDQSVNDSFPPEKLRVPFRNMIYIGDSDTDIPCMKLVNSYGGHSIGVYNPDSCDKQKVYKMIRENRIRYFAKADYSENSELDNLVKAIINRTESNEKLESISISNRLEQQDFEKTNNEQERNNEKLSAILALESSGSFQNTHNVISKINSITDWNANEIENLFQIANTNNQVGCLLGDPDVKGKGFYTRLLNLDICNKNTENAKEVMKEIDYSDCTS